MRILKFMEIGAKLVISVGIAWKVAPMYGVIVVLCYTSALDPN